MFPFIAFEHVSGQHFIMIKSKLAYERNRQLMPKAHTGRYIGTPQNCVKWWVSWHQLICTFRMFGNICQELTWQIYSVGMPPVVALTTCLDRLGQSKSWGLLVLVPPVFHQGCQKDRTPRAESEVSLISFQSRLWSRLLALYHWKTPSICIETRQHHSLWSCAGCLERSWYSCVYTEEIWESLICPGGIRCFDGVLTTLKIQVCSVRSSTQYIRRHWDLDRRALPMMMKWLHPYLRMHPWISRRL